MLTIVATFFVVCVRTIFILQTVGDANANDDDNDEPYRINRPTITG